MKFEPRTSFQYSERAQGIMEALMETGTFPNKLTILQLAGMIGFALDELSQEYKSFKSYEITRMDEHGGVEVIVDYLRPSDNKEDHPLALLERYAETGLLWLERELREPEGFSFADLIEDMSERLAVRCSQLSGHDVASQ